MSSKLYVRYIGAVIMRHYSDQDIGNKIEELEAQFRDLHTCILDELTKNGDLSIQRLLQALTLLPTKLKIEYQN